jgi:anti-anti-sigma factor
MPTHGDTARFELREQLGVAILCVSGECDFAYAEEFDRLGADAVDTGLPVAVDLTGCEFIDSSGIGRIMKTFAGAREAGQRFALAGSGPQVARVLEVSGVTDALPYFPELEDAIAYLHR